MTSEQVKRLDSLGLSFDDLVELYTESENGDAFSASLKNRGVNSKPLRAKLVKCLQAVAKQHTPHNSAQL